MAAVRAALLMIHQLMEQPHPSAAVSLSVRPNGATSVIIRLFTVHAGLTVNF